MKKKYLMLIFTILLMFAFIPNVKASSVIKWGESINEEGNVTDSAYYLGNNITSKVNTTDSIYALGNSIIYEGNSEYILAIGSSVSMKGNIVKNAYALASDVTIESTIGKDLFAAGKTVKIDGPVTGDLYVGGEDIVINTTINGNVYAAAKNIKLTSDAVINGKIVYNNDVVISKDNKAKLASTDTYHFDANPYTSLSTFNAAMFGYLNILVIGLLLLYFFPGIYKKIDDNTKVINAKEVFKSIVDGILALIVVPFIALILMIFQFGIATGAVMLVLSMILMYLSSLVTGWVIANYLKERKIFKIDNKYLIYALSLLIIYLLRLIPIVGVIVIIFTVLYGYGKTIQILFKKS